MNRENNRRILFLPALISAAFLLGSCARFGAESREDQPVLRFVVTGDSRGNDNGVNTAILGEIAQEIISKRAEFVLVLGDLVNGGNCDQATLQSQLATWRDTMQPVYDAGIAVYPLRGNHDLGYPEERTAWDNVFSGEYALPANGPANEIGLTYAVSHKNVLVLALDQYVDLNRVNQSWIDAQMAANTNTHVFACGHVPAFKVQHLECLGDYPDHRDAFWRSLEKAGCRIYFCAHDHFYDHAIIDDGDGNPGNDISQYLIGTAGAPLRAHLCAYDGDNSSYAVNQRHHAENYGYVLVEVGASKTKLTWFGRDDSTGRYLDGGSFSPSKRGTGQDQ